MWGGRFSGKPAELMQAINVSIGFDRRMATQDLAGSRAHAAMLRKAGVISSEDEASIQGGLAAIEAEIAAASREQSVGIEQVNKAVMQMDQTTQQNAALVEEATASSQAIVEQAQALNMMIARYKIEDTRTAARAPDRQVA